jgi:hypothetical protein
MAGQGFLLVRDRARGMAFLACGLQLSPPGSGKGRLLLARRSSHLAQARKRARAGRLRTVTGRGVKHTHAN